MTSSDGLRLFSQDPQVRFSTKLPRVGISASDGMRGSPVGLGKMTDYPVLGLIILQVFSDFERHHTIISLRYLSKR